MIFLFGIFNNYCDIEFVIADISDIFISIPVGLSGCLLIYWVSRIGFRGLEYIGKISLTVLCTHLYALETMGTYFESILDRTSLESDNRVWALILLEIFFAIFTALAIEKTKKIIISFNKKMRERRFPKRDVHISIRDNAIDVAKGIFIILTLVGDFAINRLLRNIIYSCHMVAFVFFSGYFYKKGHGVKKTVRHIMHNFLLPYVVFVIGVILINYKSLNVKYLRGIFIKYFMGMSFSNRIFSEIPSVGPVYFILMLFFIRIIYMFADYFIRSEGYKLLAVACISIGGMMLGKKGVWLPWSIDISCYAMIFYEIGIYCKKYDLLSRVKNYHILYFVLSPVWVYMIYAGSMEIATRNYGQYGLAIIGAVAGILLIYKLSVYISNELPVVNGVLRITGESSMILLMIHTLLGEKINNLVSYRFDRRYIFYLICAVSLQIVLSWIIKKSLDYIKSKIRKETLA